MISCSGNINDDHDDGDNDYDDHDDHDDHDDQDPDPDDDDDHGDHDADHSYQVTKGSERPNCQKKAVSNRACQA